MSGIGLVNECILQVEFDHILVKHLNGYEHFK